MGLIKRSILLSIAYSIASSIIFFVTRKGTLLGIAIIGLALNLIHLSIEFMISKKKPMRIGEIYKVRR